MGWQFWTALAIVLGLGMFTIGLSLWRAHALGCTARQPDEHSDTDWSSLTVNQWEE